MKAKRQVLQWIDGPDTIGSNGVGDEDLDVKTGENELVGKRGAPQLDVQELELEEQSASQERKNEIQKAPLDRKEKTLEAPSDPEDETLKAPLDPDEETQEAPLDPKETQKAPSNPEGATRDMPSDPGVETNDVARLAAGSTDLKGPVIPARRKLTISGNLPPNNINAQVESTGARRREGSSAEKFSADERGRR